MRNESRIRKILPVDLMLEGRPCLVVGGGRIALRKVGHLLEAGARVTVVSGTATPELAAWIEAGRLAHRARAFRAADIHGQFLVVAATDDPVVNAKILALCRARRVLGAAADANWTQGDFLTPATLRQQGLVVTVATGGQSCRRSRLVKDYLGRRLGLLGPARLVAVSFTGHPRLGAAVKTIASRLESFWSVYEFAMVRTPGGLDLLAAVSRQADITRCVGFAADGLGLKFRLRRDAAAMGRSRDLAAGPARAGLRDALKQATEARWAGMMLRDWIEGVLDTPASPGLSDTKLYETIIRGL